MYRLELLSCQQSAPPRCCAPPQLCFDSAARLVSELGSQAVHNAFCSMGCKVGCICHSRHQCHHHDIMVRYDLVVVMCSIAVYRLQASCGCTLRSSPIVQCHGGHAPATCWLPGCRSSPRPTLQWRAGTHRAKQHLRTPRAPPPRKAIDVTKQPLRGCGRARATIVIPIYAPQRCSEARRLSIDCPHDGDLCVVHHPWVGGRVHGDVEGGGGIAGMAACVTDRARGHAPGGARS